MIKRMITRNKKMKILQLMMIPIVIYFIIKIVKYLIKMLMPIVIFL